MQDHEEELLEAWMKEMQKHGIERERNIVSNEMYYNTSKAFINITISNVIDTKDIYTKKMDSFVVDIVQLGWPLIFITKGLRVLNTLVYERMIDENEYTAKQNNELLLGINKWIEPIHDEMVERYSATWEKTVSLQKIALQELSASLIPVFEKISVMPLVGTIDTDRARLIMENLLEGVVKHRADVVLIDITGVPVVDTMVAHHIIQAADAVRLVGAKCMLVGIRPEIAQTIVNLGINLNQVTTTSTLRKGIEKALEFTDRKIVKLEGMH